MNENMKRKSIEYSVRFLEREIAALRKTAIESSCIRLKKEIEMRISALEKERKYFTENIF